MRPYKSFSDVRNFTDKDRTELVHLPGGKVFKEPRLAAQKMFVTNFLLERVRPSWLSPPVQDKRTNASSHGMLSRVHLSATDSASAASGDSWISSKG